MRTTLITSLVMLTMCAAFNAEAQMCSKIKVSGATAQGVIPGVEGAEKSTEYRVQFTTKGSKAVQVTSVCVDNGDGMSPLTYSVTDMATNKTIIDMNKEGSYTLVMNSNKPARGGGSCDGASGAAYITYTYGGKEKSVKVKSFNTLEDRTMR